MQKIQNTLQSTSKFEYLKQDWTEQVELLKVFVNPINMDTPIVHQTQAFRSVMKMEMRINNLENGLFTILSEIKQLMLHNIFKSYCCSLDTEIWRRSHKIEVDVTSVCKNFSLLLVSDTCEHHYNTRGTHSSTWWASPHLLVNILKLIWLSEIVEQKVTIFYLLCHHHVSAALWCGA